MEIPISKAKGLKSSSPFDYYLNSELYVKFQKNDTFNPFLPSEQTHFLTSIGVSKRFSWGIQASSKFEILRNRFSPLTFGPKHFEVQWTNEVTVPLLRNLLGEEDRYLLDSSVRFTEIKTLETYLDMEDFLFEMLSAYWDWVGAFESFKISQEDVSFSAQNVRFFQNKLNTGRANKGDIYSSKAAFQKSLDTSQKLQTQLFQAERKLQLMSGDQLKQPTVPVMSLETSASYLKLEGPRSVQNALEARKDWTRIQLVEREKEEGRNVADWNRWPEVNLFGQIYVKGVETGIGESIRELKDINSGAYIAGLKLKMALFDSEAKSRFEQAASENLQARYYKSALLKKISKEVPEAYLIYQQNFKRVKTVLGQIEFQKKKLDYEKEDYARGRGDSYQIIQANQELTHARLSLVQAVLETHKSLALCHKVNGHLLTPYLQFLGEVQSGK